MPEKYIKILEAQMYNLPHSKGPAHLTKPIFAVIHLIESTHPHGNFYEAVLQDRKENPNFMIKGDSDDGIEALLDALGTIQEAYASALVVSTGKHPEREEELKERFGPNCIKTLLETLHYKSNDS